MFNKNKKRWTGQKIKNEEGYEVYKMRDDQALFLEASSFTPRNSFYHTVKERLKNFEMLIDKMIVNDIRYLVAITWYLGKIMGIRLAPVIMAVRMSNIIGHMTLAKIVKDIFTRPDFLANSFGYWKYCHGNIKSFPKGLFGLLKKQLESFSEVTLKGQKMLHRDIKLKDLIKILHPQPINSEMSKLYRAIIEDGKASKLKTVVDDKGKIVKSDHVTAAISRDDVSHEEKREFVQKSIDKIPINALIKNLSFLKPEDAPELKKRLTSMFKSGSGLRFINPFDLIFLESEEHRGYNSGVRVNPEIRFVCDEILNTYVAFNCPAKNPVILYDRSGSMADNFCTNKVLGNSGHRIGSKFLALLNGLFLRDFRFYTFASGGYAWNRNNNHSNLPAAIIDVTQQFKANYSIEVGPNALARKIKQSIDCDGGTELLEAIRWTVQNNPQMDLFIIITDEQSWADPNSIEAYRRMIPDRLNGKVLLINVNPSQKSVFKPSAKIVRISGLDGKIIKLIEALVDFDSFKKSVIDMFEAK